jgi:predicted AlkP superfamily pyrophosphatase or phosphodiesterase
MVDAAAIGLVLIAMLAPACDTQTPPSPGDASPRPAGTSAQVAVRRGCALPRKWLVRIWRGQVGGRSPQVIVVPKKPNYFGSFLTGNHSGPWEYLQTVPLVFYGPKRISAQGRALDQHASISDIFPTVGKLLDVPLPDRSGRPLKEAMRGGPGKPRLVVVVVWDGVGRNVLERWPSRWPNLAEMEREGTSYLRATVGSSPSITPATHATMGTGAFPREHGMPSIFYRGDGGGITQAFAGSDPAPLRLTTIADEVDKTFENDSRVGALFWTPWHLGLLGHGSALPGGDRDEMALIRHTGELESNEDFYSLPDASLPDFGSIATGVDREDGKADGRWLGHALDDMDSPAWVAYEWRVLRSILSRGRYGQADGAPDLFFINFKMSDIAGHQFFMNSKEMASVLQAQDSALGEMRDYLDQRVHDYVLVVTADHGHTPSPKSTGAWPISPDEIAQDVNEHFDAGGKTPLVEGSKTAGLILNEDAMAELDITPDDVAEWLNGYTIRENATEDGIPEGYRGDDRVLSAAFSGSQLEKVMRCKFGSEAPPKDLDA